MEAFLDYYGILGVPRYTGAEGIRRAYLRKAWQHHPDLHPDDPQAASSMSDINLAYSALSDLGRRADYDALRVTIRLRPPQDHHGPRHVSQAHHRWPKKQGLGILDSAFTLFVRLIRYATATLPL